MPAIQLARLKQQASILRDSFAQPKAYVRALRNMLVSYADYTHRPGRAGEPPALISAYKTPPPVLRQVFLEIIPLVRANQSQALALADELWSQTNLECRKLAILILSEAPCLDPDPILERVILWAKNSEERLVDLALSKGFAGIRIDASERFREVVENWMTSPDTSEQKLGLRSLQAATADSLFEDIPLAFRLLTPLVRNCPTKLRTDLVQVVRTLAERSPSETAFFLRQNLRYPSTAWVTRQSLPAFPIAMQDTLRRAAKTEQNKP
jgi:hypothetical protein